ncbi:hypothetical protein ERT44_19505, partial [Stenotrophomonas sp. MA5]
IPTTQKRAAGVAIWVPNPAPPARLPRPGVRAESTGRNNGSAGPCPASAAGKRNAAGHGPSLPR